MQAMAEKDNTKLNEQDNTILGLAMQCLKNGSRPDVDYEKLAVLAGHTNAGSTRNRMNAIFKKLEMSAGGKDSTPATPSKSRATGKAKATPSKRKAPDDDADATDAANGEPTPKKAKTPAKGRAAKAEANGDATEADAESKPKKGRTPAKSKVKKEASSEPEGLASPKAKTPAKRGAAAKKAEANGTKDGDEKAKAGKKGKPAVKKEATPSGSDIASEDVEPNTPASSKVSSKITRSAFRSRSTRARSGSATPKTGKKGKKDAENGQLENIKEEEEDEQDNAEVAGEGEEDGEEEDAV